MPDTLDAQDWIRVFDQVGAAIEAAKDRLNELDGVIGDGDHGVTMSIGFRAMHQALAGLPSDVTIDQVFSVAGKVFLNAAGGAIGPLIGTMWTDTAKALPGCRQFGAPECRRMLQIMEAAIIRRGKAKLGDKTILDALHPAVQAALSSESGEISELMRIAAGAAWSGARGTAPLVSRLGRSSRLGERTVGHEDAGANSMAVMLGAMADAVKARQGVDA